MSIQASLVAIPIIALIAIGGCEQRSIEAVERPRPVTVVTLDTLDPTEHRLTIAGRVEAWAEEDVSAEVSGRLTFVVPEGTSLLGRWVEDGEVLVAGDVMATIDATDASLAVDAAEAELGRAVNQRDDVAPAVVLEAKAQLEQRQLELGRVETAFARDAATPVELLTAQTAFRVAEAQMAAAEAGVSDAESLVEIATSSLDAARATLERTTVRAPFNAVVDDLYIVAGGFITPGTPIAHLVMMDPVQIHVTVSARTARAINIDDQIFLAVEDWPEPIGGKVLHKSATADPETGTFSLGIVARNARVQTPLEDGIVPISSVSAAMSRDILDPDGGLFVEEHKVLRQDDEGHYVVALTEIGLAGGRPLFESRRVRVTPGEERVSYQGIFVGRYLADPGGLSPMTPLAMDPPADLADGARVQVSASRWILRPGDLVHVSFAGEQPESGVYAPLDAITFDDAAQAAVFLLVDDRAVRTTVNVGAIVGNTQLIAPDDPAVSLIGAQLIVRGAHYLTDGEAVTAIREGS